jgi:hypothetical protein
MNWSLMALGEELFQTSFAAFPYWQLTTDTDNYSTTPSFQCLLAETIQADL